nr:immunoglobulin light chain junction region [Macaca mulatta]MOW66290.1 immunoglobulin light chain junction region [Macaca mulatta]MOW66360.1 immunoglobulin light chain junction region [Macaca mulatta]MOW66405.1 immunoglobulin light chain junction region [Macaca mulatta]MOW66411.1 immunoglobulin light chain junction region [Macaca mulatta]
DYYCQVGILSSNYARVF